MELAEEGGGAAEAPPPAVWTRNVDIHTFLVTDGVHRMCARETARAVAGQTGRDGSHLTPGARSRAAAAWSGRGAWRGRGPPPVRGTLPRRGVRPSRGRSDLELPPWPWRWWMVWELQRWWSVAGGQGLGSVKPQAGVSVAPLSSACLRACEACEGSSWQCRNAAPLPAALWQSTRALRSCGIVAEEAGLPAALLAATFPHRSGPTPPFPGVAPYPTCPPSPLPTPPPLQPLPPIR